MKYRIARIIMDRVETDRDLFIPRRLMAWAFDYIMARGTPVTLVVRHAHPAIEINPAPKTWASGTSAVIAYPFTPKETS